LGQIEDLRLFALVVENGSISRAAEKLHIVKSAVSRRLNLLEERFGARLIDRKPGVWEVTPTGRELYQRAIRVVNEADEIESDFTETSQNVAGPLTISVPREFGIGYLQPTLLAFKERHPEIQLTVDFDDRTIDLTRENYDFAIRITTNLEGNVVAKKIGSTRHQLCASVGYLKKHGEPTCLNDLNHHSLLNFGTARRTTWDFIGETGKPEVIEFHPTLNSNSGTFLLDATLEGLGLARLPDFITASAITSGELVPVLQNLSVPDWGIFLVHAEDRRLNRRMRLFSEEMSIACSPNSGH